MQRLIILSAIFSLLAGSALAATVTGITFTEIPNPQPATANPAVIAAGSDGKIWFAHAFLNQVGYFGGDDSVHGFKVTDPSDPNNLVRPQSIVEGPNGNAYFTFYIANNSGSPLKRSGVGEVTPGGAIKLYELPAASGDACRGFFGLPDCGITIDDEEIWFVETINDKIAKFDPSTGAFTERGVTGLGYGIDIVGTDRLDTVAITDATHGSVHWVNRTSGASKEVKLPGSMPGSAPSTFCAGCDGSDSMWAMTRRAASSMRRRISAASGSSGRSSRIRA